MANAEYRTKFGKGDKVNFSKSSGNLPRATPMTVLSSFYKNGLMLYEVSELPGAVFLTASLEASNVG